MISKEQFTLLTRRSELSALTTHGYLTANKSHKNRRFILAKIFSLPENTTTIDGVDMATLLIENGLYSTITNAYADIIGENNLIDTAEIRKFVEDYIATDIASFTLTADADGQKSLRAVKSEHIFRTADGFFAEIIIYKKEHGQYAFIREFRPSVNICSLYEMTEGNHFENLRKIPLDTITETAHISETEHTGLSVPAIFSVKGQEIFPKIETLVNAVDRSVNEVEMEIYKHHDAFLVIRNATLPQGVQDPRTGVINKNKLGKILIGSENTNAEYVTNNNPMLERAQITAEKHIARISSISGVPLEFFGIQTKEGAIGAESRSLRMTLFFAKTEKIREIIDEASEYLLGTKIAWKKIIGLSSDEQNEQNDQKNISNE